MSIPFEQQPEANSSSRKQQSRSHVNADIDGSNSNNNNNSPDVRTNSRNFRRPVNNANSDQSSNDAYTRDNELILREMEKMSHVIQRETSETRRELNELRQSVLDIAASSHARHDAETADNDKINQKSPALAFSKAKQMPRVDNWVAKSELVMSPSRSVSVSDLGQEDDHLRSQYNDDDEDEASSPISKSMAKPKPSLDEKVINYARQRGLLVGNNRSQLNHNNNNDNAHNSRLSEVAANRDIAMSRRNMSALDQSLPSERCSIVIFPVAFGCLF